MTAATLETARREDCPACGAPDRTTTLITDRYGASWPLASCLRCDVQYQLEPMTPESRRRFYGEGQYRAWVARVEGRPHHEGRMRTSQRAYAVQWGRLRPLLLRSKGPVLDFGGSTGEVSRILAADLPVVVADYGDGAPVTPEQALDVPEGHYGAVLCCQTLDHLPDPLQALRRLWAVTRAGGGLFVDVVKQAATPYKWDHETYYPTLTSFVGLVERAGWRIAWVDAVTDRRHYAVWGVK